MKWQWFSFSLFFFFSTSLSDWRFVAIDFPGHGLSSHRPDGCFYAFPLYVADVRRVVEGLKQLRTLLQTDNESSSLQKQ